MNKLLLSLVATSVVTGASATMSALVLTYVPKGEWRDTADRYVAGPGRMLYEKVQGEKVVIKLEKEGEKKLESGEKKIEVAADVLKDKVGETGAGKKAVEAVSARAEKLEHFYNIGAWAVSGFVLCFLMTTLLGISSFKTAVSLGFKVTLTFIFLQGALVFGGLLAWQKFHG